MDLGAAMINNQADFLLACRLNLKTMSHKSIIPLSGVIQNYAWGGHSFIAQLTGQAAPTNLPWAELWLGAHPKGPATSPVGDLQQLIAENSVEVLGNQIAERFNQQLPYLLKVLDVKQMLSIQAHPSKASAETGFAYEEANGPARTASNRNFRDDNHKPELGVALNDFYLLHGFKSAAAIEKTLQNIPAWSGLQAYLSKQGVKGLYQYVMEAPQATINSYLRPLAAQIGKRLIQDKYNPDFWAQRAISQYAQGGNLDRGIFSIYWFNLVHLRPGEGIFQAAGIPHAYLEGACIELMANSDNVLRGGLTQKHIDVQALLDNLHFRAVYPEILHLRSPNTANAASWSYYPTPVEDFLLSQQPLAENEQLVLDGGPAIFLVLQGRVSTDKGLVFNRGASFFLPHGASATVQAASPATLVRATANLDLH